MKSCFDSGCIVRISELMLRRGGPRPLVSTCWFTHFAGRWYFNASWSPHRYHQFFFAKTNPKNVAKQPSHFHGSWLPSYPLVYKKTMDKSPCSMGKLTTFLWPFSRCTRCQSMPPFPARGAPASSSQLYCTWWVCWMIWENMRKP